MFVFHRTQIVGNTVVLHDPSDAIGVSPCATIELVEDTLDDEDQQDEDSFNDQGQLSAAKNATNSTQEG